MIFGALPEIEIFRRRADGCRCRAATAAASQQEKSFHTAGKPRRDDIRGFNRVFLNMVGGTFGADRDIWDVQHVPLTKTPWPDAAASRCSIRAQGRCHLLLPGFVVRADRQTPTRVRVRIRATECNGSQSKRRRSRVTQEERDFRVLSRS